MRQEQTEGKEEGREGGFQGSKVRGWLHSVIISEGGAGWKYSTYSSAYSSVSFRCSQLDCRSATTQQSNRKKSLRRETIRRKISWMETRKEEGGRGGRGWERGRVGVATRQWKTMGLNRSEISALWHMRTASRIHLEDRTALNLRAPPAENVHAAAPSQPPFRR